MKPLVLNLDVTGNLEVQKVNAYINKHYHNWLDHSEWHCNKAGIPDEAVDVLNEVLLSLLQKEEEKLLKLLNTTAKYGKFSNNEPYSELDIYVLTMIRLNVTSPTSPYQHKYISKGKRYHDYDVDFSRLKIADISDEAVDHAKIILTQYRLIVYFSNALDLTELERNIFNHHFIHGHAISEWPGIETRNQLNDAFKTVQISIHTLLFEQGLTNKKPEQTKNKFRLPRIQELTKRFYQTHRVTIGKKSINQARA